jgi:hypothetical protein
MTTGEAACAVVLETHPEELGASALWGGGLSASRSISPNVACLAGIPGS